MNKKRRGRRRKGRRIGRAQAQVITVGTLVCRIFVAAVMALVGKEKEHRIAPPPENSQAISGSYDPVEDINRYDEYMEALSEYSDVILPENDRADKNYFKETLFVGDSNTEGLSLYEHLPIQYVLGYTGMAIQRVTGSACMYFAEYENPVTIPAAVGMLKPRRVIINFGTNNAGGTDTDSFIKCYKNALDAIADAYPYCDIIVESVLPVGKHRRYPDITIEDIDEFNLALAEMCREEGYVFLNTAEVFKDTNGYAKAEYFAKDGVHLNADGYRLLLDYVSQHKYITRDNRPRRGYIPARRPAPEIPDDSSETFLEGEFSAE